MRARLYLQTKAEVVQTNSQNGMKYRLGMNQFSDWTEQEFKTLLGDKQATEENYTYTTLSTSNLAKSVDWRQKEGVLNPVQNQGACGSCWAFATTACVESHHAIETGKLYKLSEQQLVDCSGPTGNEGCNGGLTT